jgi:hypothetical protein
MPISCFELMVEVKLSDDGRRSFPRHVFQINTAPIKKSTRAPARATSSWTPCLTRKLLRPSAMKAMITNSEKECPAATIGPTSHPRRGAWLTIAVDTGPGEITAAMEIVNENTNTASKELVSSIKNTSPWRLIRHTIPCIRHLETLLGLFLIWCGW